MDERIVMPGVNGQCLRAHSGQEVVAGIFSIDRRDCVNANKICSPHEFTCTHLVHFTENNCAEGIGLLATSEPFCFIPKRWDITDTIAFNLSWWAPRPPDGWMDVIKNNLPNNDDDNRDVGNSSAFNGPSLCGPVGFVISWEDILSQYTLSRQRSLDEIELRILGTFIYKREIMYAVLVCIKG